MTRIDLPSVTRWITEAATLHGDCLHEPVMARLGVSRRRASGLLKRLAWLSWLTPVEGPGRQARYKPGLLRQVVKSYELEGLQENLAWRHDFAPFFSLSAPLLRMAQHAFTELLNNAVDHSAGQRVTVSMRQTPLQLQLLVSDDGCGLFKQIADRFSIHDPRQAVLELSKGKLTSNPQRHSGRGLFVTAQLADVFDIHANESGFQRRAWERMPWREARPAARSGTSIYMAISLDTTRTLDEVLRMHSLGEDVYAFDRTVVPLHLIADRCVLASRADAKLASARLAQFRRAELDFSGVTDLGHSFVDELFRVFRRDNPQVELVPIGMNATVAAMVRSQGLG